MRKSTKKNKEYDVRELPAGYEERSDDLKGFLDPDSGPIHFIPIGAKIIDNSSDKSKSSTLLVCRFISGKVLDADAKEIALAQGDLCGVWYKPGMRSVAGLGGVPVYLYLSAERDTGKGNPMKVYRVSSPRTGQTLHIQEDHRALSKGTPSPLPLDIGGVMIEYSGA